MRIGAVAFDVDGTLYPDRSMYVRSIGLFLKHPRFVRAFGRARRVIRDVRPISDFYAQQAELVAASLRIPASRARELIDRTIYGYWESSFRGVRPFPMLSELLAELSRAGVRLGVLSDFPIGRKLEYLGLEGVWHCRLSSEETGYLKPERAPFDELARRLECDPSRILYVGNNYRYDVQGAKNAGMRAAHLCDRPVRDSVADFTFTSYDELRPWLHEVVEHF